MILEMFGPLQIMMLLSFTPLLMSIWMPLTHGLGLATDDPDTVYTEELATEVVTEVVIMATEQTSSEEREFPTIKGNRDHTDYPFIAVKFCITNKSLFSEDERELQNEISYELSSVCQRFDFFSSVLILALKPGSCIVEAAILFTSKPRHEEADLVLGALYEAVEINGTLGSFTVNELYVIEDMPGNYRRISSACDITQCPHDNMHCSSEGIHCVSRCDDNNGYCLHNSTCVDKTEKTNFIHCSCVDGFTGYQCETPPRPRKRPYSENVFIGIIAAVAVVLFCLMLLLAFLLCSKIRKRKSEYRTDIYPADVIALEMSNDYFIVGGVGCQTDDSFLLTQYMRNGIPPKPGFSHSVMQTTDSFLMNKSQGRPHVRKGKTAPAPNVVAPAKKSGTNNITNGVDANGAEKKQSTESIQRPEVPDGGVANKGAVNEGFLADEDNEAPKQIYDELRDPKKIVKV